MALSRMSKGGRWFRARSGGRSSGLAVSRSREAARLLAAGGIDRRATDGMVGAQVSEADLHAFVDGELAPPDRAEVEAFLASHPPIAGRVEAYRSQLVAVNAAFRAGEAELPPPLARLARRYAGAASFSAIARAALGMAGVVAILCTIAGASLGASG